MRWAQATQHAEHIRHRRTRRCSPRLAGGVAASTSNGANEQKQRAQSPKLRRRHRMDAKEDVGQEDANR